MKLTHTYTKTHTKWSYTHSAHPLSQLNNATTHTHPEWSNQPLQTTIKCQCGGVAAIPPFRNQRWLVKGWEETFNSQGKDYWDRYNHYLHKARIALFQHEQHVGNLHLNRTDSLWGKICSTNSFLSQILANACWAQRCRCWAFSTGGVSHNAALPPHGRQRNRRGRSDQRLIEGENNCKDTTAETSHD